MSKVNYLNLGCGHHFHDDWTNVDFLSTGPNVIQHNLLKGIPFEDNTFEVVYHSHVLEHFSRVDAVDFIKECYRVLQPNGILRIAIPDLEQITDNYKRLFNEGLDNLESDKIAADYEWMMLEMYDQTVRNQSGGQILDYLRQPTLPNPKFVEKRIGIEGRDIREKYLNDEKTLKKEKFRKKIEKVARMIFGKHFDYYRIGRLRLHGEIHQWMYDRYSLARLLKRCGFEEITPQTADSSAIPNWKSYGLEYTDGIVRKPDSLFMEARKTR
ncbi:MAG: methyltransferase domain-containing protein [Bacteroidota bacterium]